MNNTDQASVELHSRILHGIGTVTLPIHIFGAYCILFETPVTMKRVKWVMLNQHFWCCLLDLWGSFLGQPYECPPTWGGVTAGFLNTLGVESGLLVYLMVTSLQFGIIATAFLFENRFFLLFADQSWWRYGRYFYYIINIIIAGTYFLPTLLNAPDQVIAREWVFKTYPHLRNYDHPNHPLYIVAYEKDKMDGIQYRMLASIVFYLLDIWPFFMLLHWKMKRAVKEMTMSPSTVQAHKVFLRAINMQVAFPLLIVVIPQLLMVVAHFGISISYFNMNSPENSRLGYTFMSIHGGTATIVMLYCHTPYRQFCRKLFCCRRFIPSHDVYTLGGNPSNIDAVNTLTLMSGYNRLAQLILFLISTILLISLMREAAKKRIMRSQADRQAERTEGLILFTILTVFLDSAPMMMANFVITLLYTSEDAPYPIIMTMTTMVIFQTLSSCSHGVVCYFMSSQYRSVARSIYFSRGNNGVGPLIEEETRGRNQA